MNNKLIFQILCFLTLALSYVVVFSTGRSQAAVEVHSFPGVTPFTTTSGRFGLFDQSTGKIFIYDDNLSSCVFIGQLKALGEPIESIEKR